MHLLISALLLAVAPAPPKTPAGLPPCQSAIAATGPLPRGLGEEVRYEVLVDNLSIGTVEFRVVQETSLAKQPVTEFKSIFALDGLVSAFVAVSGQAQSFVPESASLPVLAKSAYKLESHVYEEEVRFDGSALSATRVRDGKQQNDKRHLTSAALDFVSAFYWLRSLAEQASGCVVVYGNRRAYTIWLAPDGQEQIETPVGQKESDRFAVRYSTDQSKNIYEGRVWMSLGALRLPYQAELTSKTSTLTGRIHSYRKPGSAR